MGDFCNKVEKRITEGMERGGADTNCKKGRGSGSGGVQRGDADGDIIQNIRVGISGEIERGG